ncbi:hypothetical protein BGX38DRAFT_1090004 [Terfezia claveryi]|nr:hypothetical protein BGX38DRAFT_1090004 [Terfezia claveryi]
MPFFDQPIHVLFVAALAATQTTAHLSIWHPCMFGSDPDNVNSDNASKPLVDRDFKGWWFHDNLDKPPKDPNTTVDLPAGGVVKLEISSNKALTSMGGGLLPNPEQAPEPWKNTGNGWGNMHANTRQEVAGSALAIAYKSNAADVTPDDFDVFSVVHDSPARQLQAYPVPAGLPPCPNNKCICVWFWIHDSRGGGDEMYMTGFQCNVTGAA